MENLSFREVWAVDFEFVAAPGEIPAPVCVVARELRTGRLIRMWRDEMLARSTAPYSTGPDAVIVAYYASAEIGCHLALGWPTPTNIIDLFTEFRCLTNGLPVPCGNGLLGALTYFGLDAMDATEKDGMRQLIMDGGPWTCDEQSAILDYCQSDVDALRRLMAAMAASLDLPRTLLRGRYMGVAAAIENVGVPMDMDTLGRLRSRWAHIQSHLIEAVDRDYGVYENGSFRKRLFQQWLMKHRMPWPHRGNDLDLSDDTFREMARAHPRVAPLHELRATLSQMRLSELAVGSDGRNRTLLSAFRARTGRNQPSNSKFIFGPAVWLRGLIQPPVGHAVVYLDWSQQEFGIAAALSGDLRMQAAYTSGDPYLAFAKQAGVAPAGATKATHGAVREQFKACVLAVQYGMGEDALAARIGQPVAGARQLLRLHRETYSTFWQWSDRAVDCAMLTGQLKTTFGWTIRVGTDSNGRSLRNFPMQANGAEMLRLACCLGVSKGIQISAPIHDAVLITTPLDRLDSDIDTMGTAMADASRICRDWSRLRSRPRRGCHTSLVFWIRSCC